MIRQVLLSRVVSAAALTVMIGGALARAGETPNLLVIHTDEHHFNTLGCYGGTIVATPNIDWLAQNGAMATSFYATTPVCSPSRSAFVSGRYPQNTPVVTNNVPMSDDVVTFAEILRRKGYATGYAGKWHLDGQGKPQWAPERKFGFEDNRYLFNRGHWKKMEDTPAGPRVAARNAKDQPSYSVEGADESSFTTDWLAMKAIDFIDANRDNPFCYMVSIPDPHGPNSVRPPYDTMYAGVEVPIPATLHKTDEQTPKWGAPDRSVSERTLARIMPAYYGMVKCIDDNVGRILDALRRQDLLENTVVVFTADHGDLCGEHGRLNKGVPYEGSAKIPFVVYYPKKIKGGTVVTQALSCVDFLPTVLSLMGVETAGREQGRDAAALFTGSAPADWEDIAFLRGTSGAGWLCAVTDDHKLVYSPQDGPWLFDLANDPDELANCFDRPDCREVVRRLTSRLAEYCRKQNDPYGEDPKIKAEMAAALAPDGRQAGETSTASGRRR
ncbi:MAG TPA: sulfatase [Thermoguttaceae bacterium]|nr:sulfatase [Thermoguttaceae bacterium]